MIVVDAFKFRKESRFRWTCVQGNDPREGILIRIPWFIEEPGGTDIQKIADQLQRDGIKWLKPNPFPESEWILDVDEFKAFDKWFRESAEPMVWLKNQMKVYPHYEFDHVTFTITQEDTD